MATEPDRNANPPRWAECLLRALLPRRDRETVSGDLLEEYREAVRPARGRLGADLWYLRQLPGLVGGVAMGVAIGLAAGGLIIVSTIFDPLADDTAFGVLGAVAAIAFLFAVAGFSSRRRGGTLLDALKAGAAAGAIAFTLIHLAAIVRVNLFLDTIRHRADWQNLVAEFERSGSRNLRAFANDVYLRQILLIPAIGTALGMIGGVLGGLAAGEDCRRRVR
jgi:hypothetical protein